MNHLVLEQGTKESRSNRLREALGWYDRLEAIPCDRSAFEKFYADAASAEHPSEAARRLFRGYTPKGRPPPRVALMGFPGRRLPFARSRELVEADLQVLEQELELVSTGEGLDEARGYVVSD